MTTGMTFFITDPGWRIPVLIRLTPLFQVPHFGESSESVDYIRWKFIIGFRGQECIDDSVRKFSREQQGLQFVRPSRLVQLHA